MRSVTELALQRGDDYEAYDRRRFEGRGVVMAGGGRLQVRGLLVASMCLSQTDCRFVTP